MVTLLLSDTALSSDSTFSSPLKLISDAASGLSTIIELDLVSDADAEDGFTIDFIDGSDLNLVDNPDYGYSMKLSSDPTVDWDLVEAGNSLETGAIVADVPYTFYLKVEMPKSATVFTEKNIKLRVL